MKYGIVVFKNTENIGDDIQSYAASKLLPKVDYYVEREHLDLFVPEVKESVTVLMNGWFLHDKTSFFLSPYINPVFISTHFSSYKTYGLVNEHIAANKDYLKKYEPIGCRDLHTQKVLEEYGIANYFSGCVTLTINGFKKEKVDDYVCCVDVSDKVVEYVKKQTTMNVVELTHTIDPEKNKNLSWDERFNNVEILLKKYQNAKVVLTSRLHCALPCLAMGVPVILIKKDNANYYDDRLSTFLEYLNYTVEKDFLKKPFEEFLALKNSRKYMKLRNTIIEDVNKKISIPPKGELPNLESYKEYYVSKKEKVNVLIDALSNEYKKLYDENLENAQAVKYWKKQYYDALKLKDFAVKQNTEFWEKEYDALKEKYDKLSWRSIFRLKK